MSTLYRDRPTVQPTRGADGVIVPRLLPVAAYLCAEDYSDRARSEALELLAAGVSPSELAADGYLEAQDVAPIARIMAGRDPYADDFPRAKTPADYREEFWRIVAPHYAAGGAD